MPLNQSVMFIASGIRFTPGTVNARVDGFISELLSTANGKGASAIGVEDAGGLLAATNVEAALAEIVAMVGGGGAAFVDATGYYTTDTNNGAFAQLSTFIGTRTSSTLTIAAGVVTAVRSYHAIDTEAIAPSDDLDTINGTTNGQFFVLKLANAAHNVVIKHLSGNIVCPSARDLTLDTTNDYAILFSDGVLLHVVAYAVDNPANAGLGNILTSTGAGDGASMVGIEDAIGFYDGTTIEAALAQNATRIATRTVSELTIAAGAVFATQTYHSIDTEADDASDDLDTINGTLPGQFTVIRLEDGARKVVIRSGVGNIWCPYNANVLLDSTLDHALLFTTTSGDLRLISSSLTATDGGGLGRVLSSGAPGLGASKITLEDADALFPIDTVEAAFAQLATKLTTKGSTTLTIAAGVITATQSYHSIDTEAAAASDDIDTINGLVEGQFLILTLIDATHNIVLKSGVGNIFCPYNADITLNAFGDYVLIFYNGGTAIVLSLCIAATGEGGLGLPLRSNANGRGASLIGTEDAGGFYPLTDNVESQLQMIGPLVPAAQSILGTDGALSGTSIDLNKAVTFLQAVGDDAANNSFTLPDGTVAGQQKIIVLQTKGGAGAAEVVGTYDTGAEILFATVRDAVILVWSGGAWFRVGLSGTPVFV